MNSLPGRSSLVPPHRWGFCSVDPLPPSTHPHLANAPGRGRAQVQGVAAAAGRRPGALPHRPLPGPPPPLPASSPPCCLSAGPLITAASAVRADAWPAAAPAPLRCHGGRPALGPPSAPSRAARPAGARRTERRGPVVAPVGRPHRCPSPRGTRAREWPGAASSASAWLRRRCWAIPLSAEHLERVAVQARGVGRLREAPWAAVVKTFSALQPGQQLGG